MIVIKNNEKQKDEPVAFCFFDFQGLYFFLNTAQSEAPIPAAMAELKTGCLVALT